MAEISIYAHRGGPLNAPENTIAAFPAGVANHPRDVRRLASLGVAGIWTTMSPRP